MPPLFLQYCPQIFELPDAAQLKFIKFITSEIRTMKYRNLPANKTHEFLDVLKCIVHLHHERGTMDCQKPEIFSNLLATKFSASLFPKRIKDELFALKLGFYQFKLEGGEQIMSLLRCSFRPDVRDRMIRTIASNAQTFLQVSSTKNLVLSSRQFTDFKNLIDQTSDLHLNIQPIVYSPPTKYRKPKYLFEKYLSKVVKSTTADQCDVLERLKKQLTRCELFDRQEQFELQDVLKHLVSRAELSGIAENLPTYEMFFSLDAETISSSIRSEFGALQLAFLRFDLIRKVNYLSAWRRRYDDSIRHVVFDGVCKNALEYLQTETPKVLNSVQLDTFKEVIDYMYPVE